MEQYIQSKLIQNNMFNKKDRKDIKCEKCGKIKEYQCDILDTPIYYSNCNHKHMRIAIDFDDTIFDKKKTRTYAWRD
jgi:hypothetical protein